MKGVPFSPLRASPVVSPPPPHFRPALNPTGVKWSRPPAFSGGDSSLAQKAGLRFERVVHRRMVELWGSTYRASPWISFSDEGESRICQPDGLLLCGGVATIFELKAQHTAAAWWQLEKLYQPLVSKLWPGREINLVEVVKDIDITAPFPVAFDVIFSLEEFDFSTVSSKFLVWRWGE